MPLNLDRSRALRSPSSLRELVDAIRDAPIKENETHWVEWKREGDLKAPEWRAEVARGILAFANRLPETARGEFEGCAYFVLGVEPGTLNGAAPYDAADVEKWLGKYVGTTPDAPAWRPDNVRIDATTWVVVITIEAPKEGDPIWTLRHEAAPGKTQMRAGTIFVRRKAATETANPQEVAALTRRACAQANRVEGLDVLLAEGWNAVAIDISDAVLDAWEETQRSRRAAAPPKAPTTQADPNEPVVGLTLPKMLKSIEAMTREERSLAQFEGELDAFIEGGRAGLARLLQTAALVHNFGAIQLMIRNNTDRPYRAIEVVLRPEEPGVEGFITERDVAGPPMPDPPIPFGSKNAWNRGGVAKLSPLASTWDVQSLPTVSSGHIEADGSISLTPIDVRARKSERLEQFYLLVEPQYAGTEVVVEWVATGTEVHGTARGRLTIPVAPTLLTVAQLLDKSGLKINWDLEATTEPN